MNYDQSHYTQNFCAINSPLWTKLRCGNRSIIVCKNNFGILSLSPTNNASCKKCAQRSLHQKPGNNQNMWVYHITMSTRKQLSCQEKHIYNDILHIQMLIPSKMTYDKIHPAQNVWTIENTLFKKLLHGYTSNIVWKIIFENFKYKYK